MFQRVALTIGVVGLLLVTLTGVASAAITITKIQYDPPGTDTGSNAHLNKEFVVIKNTGNSAVNLDGWLLKDRAGHRFDFVSFTIRAGRSVTIHTGSGTDDGNDLYQDSGAYIWNNDGDTATLKDDAGDPVDSCRYSGGDTAVIC